MLRDMSERSVGILKACVKFKEDNGTLDLEN